MAGYGKSFAGAYNRMWTDFADQAAPPILDYYRKTGHGQSFSPVLDLCCGAGTAALHFLAAGYEVTGIDASEYMLTHATENAAAFLDLGKARFLQALAQEFVLPPSFGLCVSVFDSMNHLPDVQALAACFANVHACLLPGGLFIFDLNTRRGLRRWDEITVDEDDDWLIVKRGGYDRDNGRAFYRVTGFYRENGLYQRFEETVVERIFEMAVVERMLEEAGFKAWPALLPGLGFRLAEPEDEARVCFVARK